MYTNLALVPPWIQMRRGKMNMDYKTNVETKEAI